MIGHQAISSGSFARFIPPPLASRIRCRTKLLFLGNFDRHFRAIGLGEPRLVLQSRRDGAVTDFVRIAVFVEIEQFGRQRFAAGMSLAFILVDAYFQLSGHLSVPLPQHFPAVALVDHALVFAAQL
jgi:hypothetical protein